MEYGKTVAVTGGTAIVYAVGSNEALRRTGLGYTSRALISAGAGVIAGMGIAYAGAPLIGAGFAIGGLFAGTLNGIQAVNLAMYRGKMAEPRAALPGATAVPAQGYAPTQGLNPGVTRMAPSPTRERAMASGRHS